MCFVCVFHVFSFCFTASWPNFKRFQYCFVEIFIINEIKQTTTNWINLESARPYRKWCVSQRFSRVAYLAYHMIIGTLETIRNYVYLEVYKMAFKNCFEVKQRQDSAHLPLAFIVLFVSLPYCANAVPNFILSHHNRWTGKIPTVKLLAFDKEILVF